MFFRLLLESFRRQRRRKLLAGLAIFLGTTAVTAMLALATTIGDRIHNELAVYGANIIVTPKAQSLDVDIGGVNIAPSTGNAYLHESDLAKLQTIFWHNNLTAISPELPVKLVLIPSPNSATKAAAPSSPQLHSGEGGISSAGEDDHQPQTSQSVPGDHNVAALGLWFNHDLNGLQTGAPRPPPLSGNSMAPGPQPETRSF